MGWLFLPPLWGPCPDTRAATEVSRRLSHLIQLHLVQQLQSLLVPSLFALARGSTAAEIHYTYNIVVFFLYWSLHQKHFPHCCIGFIAMISDNVNVHHKVASQFSKSISSRIFRLFLIRHTTRCQEKNWYGAKWREGTKMYRDWNRLGPAVSAAWLPLCSRPSTVEAEKGTAMESGILHDDFILFLCCV